MRTLWRYVRPNVGLTALTLLLAGLAQVLALVDPLIFGRIVDRHVLNPELGRALRQIGFVTQDPQLFSGTIRENLLFVKPDATDEEMLAAVRPPARPIWWRRARAPRYSAISTRADGSSGLRRTASEKR